MGLHSTLKRSWIAICSGGLAAILGFTSTSITFAQAPSAAPPADPTPPAVDVNIDPRPDTPTPDPQPDDPEFDGIAGRVIEVGDRSLIVLPNNSERKVTVQVPQSTAIKLNREQVRLGHLKPGDHVRIRIAAPGSNIAREILVARITPNPNPRPAPTPKPVAEERVDIEVSETKPNPSHTDAGMGLVVMAGPNGGVIIVDAQENSPAAKAGLRAGDVLLSLEGEELLTPQEYITRVRGERPGEKVSLVVMRGGNATKGQVSLVRRDVAPDVIIRRPGTVGQVSAVGAVAGQAELEVAADAPAAVGVPAADPFAPVAGQAGTANLQQLEQTLQVLVQEIRALRQELRGGAGGVAVPRTPAETPPPAARQDGSRKSARQNQ